MTRSLWLIMSALNPFTLSVRVIIVGETTASEPINDDLIAHSVADRHLIDVPSACAQHIVA